MVPLKLAGTSGGVDYVISFGVGVAIVTCVMWLLFILVLRIQRRPIPSLQLRVMWLPGSIAGIVWSAGNFFSTCATILLGEANGYSSCQGERPLPFPWPRVRLWPSARCDPTLASLPPFASVL